ncbi:uncharacterized protein TM35_000202310 [Trypanosoma theileri]|uniref:Uncharacterized protein n=1 Tax=Trypanosoma theileri TaxID=67003 RepID=A0A1X0NT01_9TRYP|nr:uncharacterized protein TM35_000202310 [Trypanosoma theileri]ORC87822.1 hypothetical protein TM35_000202310 [Trypanosoma theileri]
MARKFFTAVLILLLFLQTVNGAIVVGRVPDGAYCGNYSYGLVTGRISLGSLPNTFDIALTVFGDDYNCKNERYKYDEKTNKMEVPDSNNPNDCLGKLLVQNKLTLSVQYYPKEDELELDLGIAKIMLTQCG